MGNISYAKYCYYNNISIGNIIPNSYRFYKVESTQDKINLLIYSSSKDRILYLEKKEWFS